MTRRSILILLIPLSLSAFTHLWNPVGFPDIFYDEGVYMRRALHVLVGLGPQESATFYDHPFFGQLFLAGIFKLIGFPDSLDPSSDIHSIEMLYLIPRVLMGILAVIDTFLIYKISEHRYNRNVALIASVMFAVMPMTWFTRRILLDSLLLPFLLSSILFALFTIGRTDVLNNKNKNRKINKNILLVLLSGICLGVAIFTKIPVFVTIPLIAFLILKNNNRSWKILGLWFIPVILIPLIWPAYSLALGQFDHWWEGILRQAGPRNNSSLASIPMLIRIDPVFMVFALGGLIFAALKKDLFILIWVIPTVLFLYLTGYYPYRALISLIPIFSIGAAVLIVNLIQIIKIKNLQRVLLWSTILVIGTIGLVSSTLLITTNMTSSQFETAAFVSTYLSNYNNKMENITLSSSPIYSWIFNYVYHNDHVLSDYRDIMFRPIPTNIILLIADEHFNHARSSNERLETLYQSMVKIAGFNGTRNNFNTDIYPYSNILLNNEGLHEIEVGLVNKSVGFTLQK